MQNDGMTKKGITGGGPLLMASVSLCLAALTMLGAYQASAHWRTSEKCAAEASAWYDACVLAEQDLSDVREHVSAQPFYVRKSYPISDTQTLEVEYEVLPDGSYDIYRWQAVPAGEWEETEFIEGIY